MLLSITKVVEGRVAKYQAFKEDRIVTEILEAATPPTQDEDGKLVEAKPAKTKEITLTPLEQATQHAQDFLGFVYDNSKGDKISDLLFDGETATVVPPATYTDIDHAKNAMMDYIDKFTASVTGRIPNDEKASWPAKDAASKAYIAGTADDDQKALIETEASITKENPLDLANSIAGKAALYRLIVAQITGLRRATEAALDASPPEHYDTIMAGAMAQAEAAAAQILGS